MDEYRSTLERELDRLSPPRIPFDQLVRRRERKRRDQRIRAGALGLAIAIAVGWLSANAIRSAVPTPGDDPAPTSVALGALAYAVEGDIFVAEWDGSNPVKIADGRPPSNCKDIGEYWAEGPMWSPDGRYLAFRHTDCDGPADAWWDVVISDARGNVVTSFLSQGWNVAWSPDSTRVVVWEHWGDFGEQPRTIGIYGLDGVRRTLLSEPLGSPPTGESDPEWSRDGQSILLASGLEIPIDGGTPRLLPWADAWADRGVGAWAFSPDGSRLALAVDRSFVIADADGSHPQEVLGDWPGNLLWSPTGDRIAFGIDELRLLDVATGNVSSVVEVDGPDIYGIIDFSPEGERIFFSVWEGRGVGARSLWSVNVDGSELRRVVTGTVSGDWYA